MKVSNKLKKIVARINRVDKVLLAISMFSIALIFVRDLVLVYINSPNKFIYVLGVFSYNLCLAYLGSFIFYIVTVHIPKERKRIKTNVTLMNKIIKISELDRDLLNVIMNSDNPKYTSSFFECESKILKEDFEKKCKQINAQNPVIFHSGFYSYTFNNWFEMIQFTKKRFKELVVEFYMLSDFLDERVTVELINIDNMFDQHFSEGVFCSNESLEVQSHIIWNIHSLFEEILKIRKEIFSEYISNR